MVGLLVGRAKAASADNRGSSPARTGVQLYPLSDWRHGSRLCQDSVTNQGSNSADGVFIGLKLMSPSSWFRW